MEIIEKRAFAILKFKDGSFFIPTSEEGVLDSEFESLGGRHRGVTPFGNGWWFANLDGELEDLREFFKEQTISYIFVYNMDMEVHTYF